MLWIKTFHILAMTSWMAGIFYLPRIFVHYVEGREAGQDVARLEIMAGKLYGFMTIMAIFTLGLRYLAVAGVRLQRWLAARQADFRAVADRLPRVVSPVPAEAARRHVKPQRPLFPFIQRIAVADLYSDSDFCGGEAVLRRCRNG